MNYKKNEKFDMILKSRMAPVKNSKIVEQTM